jgi:hypothetical protein
MEDSMNVLPARQLTRRPNEVPGFPLAAGLVIDANVDDLIDGPWHTHLMALLAAAANLENRRYANNRFAGIPPTPTAGLRVLVTLIASQRASRHRPTDPTLTAPEAPGWCA